MDSSIKSLHQQHLTTQITSLLTSGNIILVGEGQYLLVYNYNNEYLNSIKVFTKVSIHGISLLECVDAVSKISQTRVLVWGQRSFAVLLLCHETSHCSLVIPEQIVEDWIVTGQWLHPSLSTAGNCLPLQSLKGSCLACHEDLILLTAHSALLRYSLTIKHTNRGSTCSLQDHLLVAEEHKSLYQLLEEIEVNNCSEFLAPKARLVDRVQCSETCILFSGCIILGADNKRGGSVCCSAGSGCSRRAHAKTNSTAPRGTSESHASTQNCQHWEECVCVGGTVFGGLLVWGVGGSKTREEKSGEVVQPWHQLQAHKGVVFSVSWCPALGLLTTTSDDRTISVWAVTAAPHDDLHVAEADCSSNKNALYNTEKNSGRSNAVKFLDSSKREENNFCQDLSEKTEVTIFNISYKTGMRAAKKTSNFCCFEITDFSWQFSTISQRSTCHGHQARVWRSLCVHKLSAGSSESGRNLPSLASASSVIVSAGEDSNVCLWSLDGNLLKSWRAHDGASVWCVTSYQQGAAVVLVTAGGDGAVKKWNISEVFEATETIYKERLHCNSSLCDDDSQSCKKLSHKISRSHEAAGKCHLPWLDVNPIRCGLKDKEQIQSGNKNGGLSTFIGKGDSLNTHSRAICSKLSSSCGGQSATFVRCLGLLDTSTCIVTLDNGDVWLWRLDCHFSNVASSATCGSGHRDQNSDDGSASHTERRNKSKSHCEEASLSGGTSRMKEWHLVMQEPEKLRGYSLVAVNNQRLSGRAAAAAVVCGLYGDVFLLELTTDGSVQCNCSHRLAADDNACADTYSISTKQGDASSTDESGSSHATNCTLTSSSQHTVTDKSVSDSKKVFSAAWVSATRLLLCTGGGLMHLYEWRRQHGHLPASLHHVSAHQLPPCKQWWVTAACLAPVGKTGKTALLVGDRGGSLHLYVGEEAAPSYTERSVHGRSGGVVHVATCSSSSRIVVSTGRDGWIRYWTVRAGQQRAVLHSVRGSRHGCGSWVARLTRWQGAELVMAFRDVYLEVWSSACNAVVAQVECGGGHRAWDVLFTRPSPHTAGSNNTVVTVGSVAATVLPQALTTDGSASNTLCGELVGAEAKIELICAFLKDGVPCATKMPMDFSLSSVKTGLSSKALLCAEALHHSPASSGNGSLVAVAGEDNTLRLLQVTTCGQWRLLAAITSHISAVRSVALIRPRQQVASGVQVTTKESRGFTVDSERFSREANKVNEAEASDSHPSDQVWFITAGGRAQMKIWRGSRNNFENVMEECKQTQMEQEPNLSSSGGNNFDMLPCQDQTAELECSEVLNHQLMEDRPTSWRQQQEQVEAETRHMACSGVWLSTNTAVIALASSDATLRLFAMTQKSDTSSSKSDVALSLTHEYVWSHCFLCVHVHVLRVDASLSRAPAQGGEDCSDAATVTNLSETAAKGAQFEACVGSKCSDGDTARASTDGITVEIHTDDGGVVAAHVNTVAARCISVRGVEATRTEVATEAHSEATVEAKHSDAFSVNCKISRDAHTVSDIIVIRATDTAGRLIYWTSEQKCAVTGKERKETLHLVTQCQLHQSGINSVAASTIARSSRDNNLTLIHSEHLLTGGDDNKIVLSRVEFRVKTQEHLNDTSSFYGSEILIDVFPITEVIGHSSQVTGLSWISSCRFISASVDQRIIVWRLSYSDVDCSVLLVQEHLVFSGVPDIHDMIAWSAGIDINTEVEFKSSEEMYFAVFGVGCEVWTALHNF